MSATPVDPSRCPLCGDDNACGAVSGSRTCWCHAVRIPPEVLARVPLEAKDVACVCAKCAAATPRDAQPPR